MYLFPEILKVHFWNTQPNVVKQKPEVTVTVLLFCYWFDAVDGPV